MNTAKEHERNDWLTDEEVEQEIEKLQKSEYVKLARKEARIKYRRRQRLYTLRFLDKKGRQLAENGVTLSTLAYLYPEDYEEQNNGKAEPTTQEDE